MKKNVALIVGTRDSCPCKFFFQVPSQCKFLCFAKPETEEQFKLTAKKKKGVRRKYNPKITIDRRSPRERKKISQRCAFGKVLVGGRIGTSARRVARRVGLYYRNKI